MFCWPVGINHLAKILGHASSSSLRTVAPNRPVLYSAPSRSRTHQSSSKFRHLLTLSGDHLLHRDRRRPSPCDPRMPVEAQTLCVLVLYPHLASRISAVRTVLRWVFKVISPNGSEITRIYRPSMCIEFDSPIEGSTSQVVDIVATACTRVAGNKPCVPIRACI